MFKTESTYCEDIHLNQFEHQPVMLEEVVDYLNPQNGQIFFDGTLGLGGHAAKILEKIGPNGRYVGVDRDIEAIKIAKENLRPYVQQCHVIQDTFDNINFVLDQLDIKKVDGILLDLGLSSLQLDDAKRGFSFKTEAPLDMRMDQSTHISAFDLINSLSEKELVVILKEYGQERWAQRIARNIVRLREESLIQTTKDLEKIVFKSLPYRSKRELIHPATRTFQAFRIAVNRELDLIQSFLDKCIEHLNQYGRVAIISFHSLEDRIVKHSFRELERQGKVNVLLKKPLRPTEEEKQRNPRARSARLRVAERI